MTYAPTIDYLQTTALGAGAASFWYGKQQTQSINYAAPFPQAHLFLLPAPLVGANVQYRIVMAFYGKDEHENGSADSITLQDEMDVLTQQFIANLRDDGQFDVSEQVDRAPALREGAQIGTGFVISFTLTARAAVC